MPERFSPLRPQVTASLAGPSRADILPLMSAPFRPADTTPEAWAKQFELYRRMSPAEKARLCSEVTMAANAFTLAGLRRRHADASDGELLLRLAVLRLGADLVERAYHWRAPPDGA
jgi:hypothetical protein